MAPKGKEVKSEGKYFELEGAVEGEVVVRFPPEASGYLHIGHAKAALLNAHYQQHYKGKLVMRFDDTNPEKEKEAFEKIIEGDVELLNIKPDCLTYSSDYFDLMLEKAEGMIKQSKAYVDDTPAEQMKNEREQRVESKNRNNDVATNLKMWEEMKNGSELGQTYCLRAKVDMKSDNGAMRDPTIYRCKPQEHPRSGLKYKCYPTYDFACPIVDSIEGITHALRTSEYMDRDAQYYWFCDALEIRKPRIAAYSRLSLMNTVLSKRKLTYFVQEGVVTGWDDPRMPTVRGILRRGLTVEGLKQFIAAQGSSKAIVVMEWDKIWAFNRKVIDPQAGRYSAVENLNSVVVDIDGTVPTEPITVALHPKNAEMGTRAVPVGAKLIIDQTDAQLIQPNTTVTFLSWGNLHINEVQKNGDIVTGIKASLDLENRDFKKTLKASWLEKDKNALPARLVYYDNIIRKPVLGKDDDFKQFMNMNSKFSVDAHVDVACKTLKVGDIIQIQRKGFFIVDKAYESAESPIELISIPDGTTDMNIFPKSVQEWKKSNVYVEPEKPKAPAGDAAKLDGEIRAQGEVVRVMKSNGAAKDAVTAEVQKLLALKAQYKTAAGKDWKPEAAPAALKQADKPAASAAVALSPEGEKLNSEIKAQGEAVRDLKAKGGSKDAVTAEVQKLLALKAQFKTVTGKDWKPEAAPAAPKQDAKPAAPAAVALSPEGEKLNAEIKAQGEAVRDLKSKGGSKDAVTAEVQKLLALKTQFKEVTGNEWKPEGGAQPRAARQEKPKAPPAPKQAKQPKPAPQKNPQAGDSGKVVKKQTRLGMETSKSDNYSEWYTEVITKAEMIEYYDVSGCYILRPWSYAIWEKIQAFFDAKIKSIGVMNCYFPMFISKSALETEKTHIADFAPEVAWVTKSGQSDLAEPIAIRPTSETVMYPSFGKWIQSYRDLPIQLNQWCNVVRWEFKQPTPFLRTREFLWQEGHSAHGTQEDTMKEVLTILDFYAAIYEELLAIPVVKGKKTEKEKFAGGDMTTTVEAYVDVNGRGIQGATSHYLGQNFSKMFDVSFEDPEKPGEKAYAYQTSWGLSTRTIGALIMIHGDDKGLVLPPNVAAIQSVIVPCGITASTPEDDKKKLVDACHQLAKSLRDGNVKVKVDDGDQHSPGWKFNHWELKGVPIRVELGPKDLAKGEFVAVRRDNGEKISFKLDNAANDVQTLLKSIHENMFARATKVRDDHMTVTESWDTFIEKLEQKFIIMAPFCGEPSCEDRIKDDSKKDDVADASGGPLMGAKSLCIPFAQPKDVAPGTKCIHGACTRAPKYYTLFGRSY